MQSTACSPQSTALSSLTDLIELRAKELASHSWEHGTVSHALLSLHNPELTVFTSIEWQKPSSSPLPPGLAYAKQHISTTRDTLYPSDKDCISDPASLGVAAILLGRLDDAYLVAAERQLRSIVNSPRWGGAISHRKDSLTLWADAVAMVPPFIAFFSAAVDDDSILDDAIYQIRAYHARLLIKHDEHSAEENCEDVDGSWRHIVSEPPRPSDDLKPWSTSNAWALWGITRVLATVINANGAQGVDQGRFKTRATELLSYAKEIIDAAIRTDDHESGLLRNYWGDVAYEGETSGTALITAALYRLVTLDKSAFGHYLDWADKKRKILESCVREDGVVGPAANALNHFDKEPLEGGSAEGQAFKLEMIAACRDWEQKKDNRS